jgi:hypothetical protein
MLIQIYWAVVLSIVVASVAWTVTQEEIFSEWRDEFKKRSETSKNIFVRKFFYVWTREYCEKKSETCKSLLQRKFFYVFTCEYCFSHWVTILILLLTGFRLVIDDWRGYILAFFALPWLANQWISIYRRLRVGIKHENLLAEEVKTELGK